MGVVLAVSVWLGLCATAWAASLTDCESVPNNLISLSAGNSELGSSNAWQDVVVEGLVKAISSQHHLTMQVSCQYCINHTQCTLTGTYAYLYCYDCVLFAYGSVLVFLPVLV